MKLTKEQSKIVIEYFSQRAAQGAPVTDLDWAGWDRHMWMTNYQASLAIGRRINEHDWAALVNAQLDVLLFDRNPAGYLFDRGEEDNEDTNNYYHEALRDILSAHIDTAFNTSKAA